MGISGAALFAYMAVLGTDRDSFLKSDFKPSDVPTLTIGAREKRTHCACSGSGFFITANGWLLTNHHVVEKAVEIAVVHKGNAFLAEVTATNKEKDLALLKINLWPHGTNVSDKVPFLKLRKDDIRVGETVFAVGYPRPEVQGFEAKVTCGIVNSLSGFQGSRDELQIDAAVFGGNSGGPLIDDMGCAIGINSSGARGSQSCNYAIKMNVVKDFLPENVTPEWSTGGRRHSAKWLLEKAIAASVLVLAYQRGAYARVTSTEADGGDSRRREASTLLRQSILNARLLKVRKEWKDLIKLTDDLLDRCGEVDDVREMNELARDELGMHLTIFAEADGRDIVADIKPVCGFKDDFVRCGEPTALYGGRNQSKGFPVEATLTYDDGEWLWQGDLKCRYTWRGTKEIRVIMRHVGKKYNKNEKEQ